jgi:hypothetical protein
MLGDDKCKVSVQSAQICPVCSRFGYIMRRKRNCARLRECNHVLPESYIHEPESPLCRATYPKGSSYAPFVWCGEEMHPATPLHSMVRSHQTVRTAGRPPSG